MGTPSTKSVLIIEDERFIGQLYQQALQRAGYAVTVCFDGKQGLSLAQSDQFDIILLDLMLPQLSGSEVLQTLRGTSNKPIHSHIIIITNLEQPPQVRTRIEAMADGYLVKANTTPKGLLHVLQQLQ